MSRSRIYRVNGWSGLCLIGRVCRDGLYVHFVHHR